MFCAVAVSGTSTVVPLKPRKQSRLSSRMRFMSQNASRSSLAACERAAAGDSVLSVQHDRDLCRRRRPLLFKVRDIFNVVGCE